MCVTGEQCVQYKSKYAYSNLRLNILSQMDTIDFHSTGKKLVENWSSSCNGTPQYVSQNYYPVRELNNSSNVLPPA